MSDSERPHVVFVDDDRTTAQLVKMLLELNSFRVSTSPDAATVLNQAPGDVAAFVIDCHLSGGKSGLDLLRAIRNGETSFAADTPIVVASGDYLMERKGLEAGSDRFIMKPFQPSELVKMLNRLLERTP